MYSYSKVNINFHILVQMFNLGFADALSTTKKQYSVPGLFQHEMILKARYGSS